MENPSALNAPKTCAGCEWLRENNSMFEVEYFCYETGIECFKDSLGNPVPNGDCPKIRISAGKASKV